MLADPGKKVVTRNAPVLLDTLLNVRKDAAFQYPEAADAEGLRRFFDHGPGQ